MEEIFFEALGWLSAFFFLYAYFNLVRGKWQGDDMIYHTFNFVGCILLVINTIYYYAWAATFINVAWGGIALYGMVKRKVGKS
ncbi:CBU_0592 family membrane protein [Fulvivirga ligni]|uniref:CBU_0592 family membrane protein n=1 Tax=Fulvivirga ligni TaxID=2904246 RepID=UPI001F3ED5AD|nr:hypothetical protein [Fulvivirga ligni]UII22846.1 hypothetical protein LVD16_06375 [Fulvivirga ligni]